MVLLDASKGILMLFAILVDLVPLHLLKAHLAQIWTTASTVKKSITDPHIYIVRNAMRIDVKK